LEHEEVMVVTIMEVVKVEVIQVISERAKILVID